MPQSLTSWRRNYPGPGVLVAHLRSELQAGRARRWRRLPLLSSLAPRRWTITHGSPIRRSAQTNAVRRRLRFGCVRQPSSRPTASWCNGAQRQRLCLPELRRLQNRGPRQRRRAALHPAAPAPDQRQGGALQPHAPRGMGLRSPVHLKPATHPGLGDLAAHLQLSPSPHQSWQAPSVSRLNNVSGHYI
jgi:hypothetical protein